MYAYNGNKVIRGCLLCYTILFWCTGLALVFLGLYMILEPKRSYILDLVDFSEDDPLLRFAAYASIVTGIATLLVGFLACCGAIKAERCMVVSDSRSDIVPFLSFYSCHPLIVHLVHVLFERSFYSVVVYAVFVLLLQNFLIFLVFIFFAEISIGVLGILYREKFTGDRMEVYLSNMSHNRYYRDKWVLPLMDTIQFYLNCCGSHSPSDWLSSQWRSTIPPDSLIFDPGSPQLSVPNKSEDEATNIDPANLPIVPDSCCVQMQGATVNNRIARSLIRCQQPGTARLWRHQLQQCCGGKGPMDYYDSYWYITNTMHGTRSFVPPSCCKQSQEGRAWSIQPIDPMCTTYVYYTTSFNNSVNIQGCHERLQRWFNEQTILFAAIGFAFAAFQIVGMCVSVVLWRRINDYLYVDSYER